MFSNEPLQATAQQLHGLVSCAEWTGVPLSTLLDETGIDPKAKWLIAEGADSLALHPQRAGEEGLRRRDDRALPERRAAHAGQRLSDAAPAARLPRQHEREVPAPHQARRPAGHELLRGAHLLAAPAGRQGVPVLLPAGGEILHHPAVVRAGAEGAGLSTRFPASPIPATAASRRSWSPPTAARAGRRPRCRSRCRRKAFTRFRMPWRWDGGPAILQSRAWDEPATCSRPARSSSRCAARPRACRNRRLPEPALQQPDQLGGRAERAGQACLRVSSSPAALLAFGASARRPRELAQARQADHRGRHHGLGHQHPAGRHRPAARQRHRGARRQGLRGKVRRLPRRRRQGRPQRARCVGGRRRPAASTRRRPSPTSGPYATTVFDFTRRAMPFRPAAHAHRRRGLRGSPPTSSSLNKIIGENDVMDAKTLPQVKMPNRDNFIIQFPDRI